MKLKTIVGFLKELFRPLTPEEKKQAGIISAHAYREDKRLKELGRITKTKETTQWTLTLISKPPNWPTH